MKKEINVYNYLQDSFNLVDEDVAYLLKVAKTAMYKQFDAYTFGENNWQFEKEIRNILNKRDLAIDFY